LVVQSDVPVVDQWEVELDGIGGIVEIEVEISETDVDWIVLDIRDIKSISRKPIVRAHCEILWQFNVEVYVVGNQLEKFRLKELN